MLSWSSTATDQRLDLAAVADGRPGVGLAHGDALLRFAGACGGTDDVELAAARAALVAETDEAFMVDAAAVAANFEMMTRLADGTGAAMPAERLANSAQAIETMRHREPDEPALTRPRSLRSSMMEAPWGARSRARGPMSTASFTLGRAHYPVVLPELRDPRLHVAAVIVTIHVLGQVALGFQVSVPQILAAILTCAVIEVTVTFRAARSFVWPASAMLTGSGVALILRVPGTPPGDHWSTHAWWVFAGVAAFSLSTKYLIRYRGSHLFNPSNLGLVVAFVVLGSTRLEPLDFWWSPLERRDDRRLHGDPGRRAADHRPPRTARRGGDVLGHARGRPGAPRRVRSLHGRPLGVRPGVRCRLLAGRSCSRPSCSIFLFFMITDPKTVPAGRRGRVVFGFARGRGVHPADGAADRPSSAPRSPCSPGWSIVCAVRPLLDGSSRTGSLPTACAPRRP